MSTSLSWPGGSTNATPTLYSIPAAGEVNWAALSDFLIALGNSAQGTTFQKFADRVATTSPVTVSVNDCIVISKLAVAAAVAVNFPAGVDKFILWVVDGTGDAQTHNITITPNGTDTIEGAATYVMAANGQAVGFVFNAANNNWKLFTNTHVAIGSIPLPSADIIVGNSSGLAQARAMTGDIAITNTGATSIVATTNSTLTTLSALTTAGSLATVGTIGAGVWQGTTVAVGFGGTGVSSVTVAPTATAFAGWDGNKNLSANSLIDGYATTSTAAGTTTLTVASAKNQFFTGVTTQTVVLPVASTLVLGQQFIVYNNSSGIVTVQSSGANTVQAMAGSTRAILTCILTSGTTAASWSVSYSTSTAGITALTGDVSATGPGSVAASLTATTNATLTTLSGLTTASSLVTIGTITSGTWSATTIAINKGGTGVTSVTTAPAATAFAGWDANKNFSSNSFLQGYTTTATGAGTTTLVVGSTELQYFTGVTTQTVVLPVTSTLVLGQRFEIVNLSTGIVTVQSSGTNTVQAMIANTRLIVTCILTSGTTAASWSSSYNAISLPIDVNKGGTGITSGTSGGILGFTASGTIASSAALTVSQVVIGGGAGATPTTLAAGSNGQFLGITAGVPTYQNVSVTVPTPTVQIFTATGTVNYYPTYTFVVTSANATVGATYTNNAVTYTVLATIASGTQLQMSGSGTPSSSGTLTKATGSGDATITFSAFFSPKWAQVELMGAGGGGGSSGTGGAGTATAGTASAFKTSAAANIMTCGGGGLGQQGNTAGVGGSVTVGTGYTGGTLFNGGNGGPSGSVANPSALNDAMPGGNGGVSPFGGAGGGGLIGAIAGFSAQANTGSGGGGAGAGTTSTNNFSGSGGGAGGYAKFYLPSITTPAGYQVTVGTKGNGASAGTLGAAGGNGADGFCQVTEYYI